MITYQGCSAHTMLRRTVELEPSALFRSFQRNADAFIVNWAQSERRMAEIRETRTIRAPLPTQGKSFRPQYGDALMVHRVDSVRTQRLPQDGVS